MCRFALTAFGGGVRSVNRQQHLESMPANRIQVMHSEGEIFDELLKLVERGHQN